MKDIVVLIPGITGSVLERDGREVFALTAGAGLRALFSGGDSIRGLALAADALDQDELDDGVRATRVAPDATLIPRLWKIDGYGRVTDQLRAAFELVDGENFFAFAYDWRRDNRVAARRLQRESEKWLHRRRQDVADAKLVLVAHSMGGLVSRYFLEVLGGWRDTRRLITFGTPFRGSLNALDTLSNGFSKAFGLVDLSATLRSFTSVHQLLPIYPCLDTGDGELRRLTEVPEVPNVDASRIAAADGFHREIERAVEANADDEEYRATGYRVHPIVGNRQPTGQSARVRAGGLEILRTWQGEDPDGDGTVPMPSAVPIELSDQRHEILVAGRHASLQNADHVVNQLRGMLTESKQYRWRAGAPVTVSLDLDDLYAAGEPVAVRARLSDPSSPARATFTPASGAGPALQVDAPPTSDGWRTVTTPPLAPGVWRVVVSGDEDVQPSGDLFVVAEADAT